MMILCFLVFIFFLFFFFFQAEDGIRDWSVTGVQTCALPILSGSVQERTGAAISIIATSFATSGPWRCGKDNRYHLTFRERTRACPDMIPLRCSCKRLRTEESLEHV